MILPMSKVRILGPKAMLSRVMPIVQDFGQLHVTPPHETGGLVLVRPDPAEERRERQLTRISQEVRRALDELGRSSTARAVTGDVPERRVLAAWARRARAVGSDAGALRDRKRALEEERAFLGRYRELFGSFQALAEAAAKWPGAAAYHVVLPRGGERALSRLREGLREMLGDEFEVWSRELKGGETGVLLLVPREAEERLEELFRSARVQEVELPGVEKGMAPSQAIPRIVERFEAIPAKIREVDEELARLASKEREPLERAEAVLNDALARLDMVERVGETDHAFVLEGWVPSSQESVLRRELHKDLGDTAVVEEVSQEEWVGEDVPVVLNNPRLFRPFETIVRILPLPRYGSVDPTPFLAIFFPMFFGLVLGDVGYGLVLGALAMVARIKSRPGSTLRAVSEIAGACAAFTVIFGFLYGELFGDAGARLFGMEALAIRREEALLPFLVLALGIGVVHILLGLVLNLLSKRHEGGRAMIGPGVTLAMVVLVVLSILAAVDVLPRAMFTPAVLLTLVLFPILVVVEGILGPTELLSTLGHILSYARVMAVGTASVMMAIAANRMIGTMGSVLVGSLFALIFHLVNFALGVFSPTVHALRLHFVEFFGTFYSPGGTKYEPFGHWAPARTNPSTDTPPEED
jgi:V/A-type H+-transporting ATPase subunit I